MIFNGRIIFLSVIFQSAKYTMYFVQIEENILETYKMNIDSYYYSLCGTYYRVFYYSEIKRLYYGDKKK